MGIEENKAVVRRSIEALNNMDVQALEGLFAPALQAIARQNVASISGTWGEHHAEITDMIAEGDKVWARVATSGGHIGEFLGIPPTGKHWTNTGILFHRLEGGKIVEFDVLFDVMHHVTELGATLTPPAQVAAARN